MRTTDEEDGEEVILYVWDCGGGGWRELYNRGRSTWDTDAEYGRVEGTGTDEDVESLSLRDLFLKNERMPLVICRVVLFFDLNVLCYFLFLLLIAESFFGEKKKKVYFFYTKKKI